MEIKDLKKIRIVDFCHQNGIGVKQDSREYYRLEEFDSCVISDKKNVFKWNSKNVGGDIFDFIKEYYNCSFKEAKQKLMDSEYEIHEFVEKPRNEPFIYYENNESEMLVAKKYLIENRKISSEIVEDLIERDLIKQDKRGNVLFLWKEKENVVGCTEQGTRSYYSKDKEKNLTWKKIQENSKEYAGFKLDYGEPKDIYFFESEIDILSYITQKPERAEDSSFISMNGLKLGTVLHATTAHYNAHGVLPENIYMCVDNDEAGRTFLETEFDGKGIGGTGIGHVEIKKEQPLRDGFDWNDNLTKGSEIINSMSANDLSNILEYTRNSSSFYVTGRSHEIA